MGSGKVISPSSGSPSSGDPSLRAEGGGSRRFREIEALRVDYSSELNPAQLEAVTAPPGPALVLAGAGAGKTRTLTYRVAYLIEQGVPQDRILLLTFTNKAAREMMGRVTALLNYQGLGLWGGTFHSIANRILRRHAERLGYPGAFTILDRDESKKMVGRCIEDLGGDRKAHGLPKADVLMDVFSLAANLRQPLAELIGQRFAYLSSALEKIEEVQRRYIRRKQESAVMDFDDLLEKWLVLIEREDDLREHYQRRFQFILVDEFQDTNRIQSDLIDLLAQRHHQLMVVGDDSQSIYSWRGAYFLNLLNFPKRYPEAKIYKIETNYRSTPEILELANAVIASNADQFPKALAAVRPSGRRPVRVTCWNARDQARFVVDRLMEVRARGIPLREVAVLYRSHFHALELQLELTRAQIAFTITSGLRLFEQAHIKDVVAYLKLICNPRDESAFLRLVSLLPGVGKRGASKLWNQFRSAPPRPLAESEGGWGTALGACEPGVPKRAKEAWKRLRELFGELTSPPVWPSPALMIGKILESGYQEHLQRTYDNFRNRLDDLEELARFAETFPSPNEFLAQLALLTNIEAEAERVDSSEPEGVHLSTVHQAKGLEFAVVFVLTLVDGMFPSSRSMERLDALEEERRLLYVAITRAKNELYLISPEQGYRPGLRSLPGRGCSTLIGPVPEELTEWEEVGGW